MRRGVILAEVLEARNELQMKLLENVQGGALKLKTEILVQRLCKFYFLQFHSCLNFFTHTLLCRQKLEVKLSALIELHNGLGWKGP